MVGGVELRPERGARDLGADTLADLRRPLLRGRGGLGDAALRVVVDGAEPVGEVARHCLGVADRLHGVQRRQPRRVLLARARQVGGGIDPAVGPLQLADAMIAAQLVQDSPPFIKRFLR